MEGVGPKLAANIVEFFAKLKKRPAVEEELAGEVPTEAEIAAMGPADGSMPEVKAALPAPQEPSGAVEKEPGVVEYQLKPRPT